MNNQNVNNQLLINKKLCNVKNCKNEINNNFMFCYKHHKLFNSNPEYLKHKNIQIKFINNQLLIKKKLLKIFLRIEEQTKNKYKLKCRYRNYQNKTNYYWETITIDNKNKVNEFLLFLKWINKNVDKFKNEEIIKNMFLIFLNLDDYNKIKKYLNNENI